MTIIDAILKAKAHDYGKYSSPPPEPVESDDFIKIKRVHKYAHVRARVDSSPPRYDPAPKLRNLQIWRRHLDTLFNENINLLMLIKKAQFFRGRVDTHWHKNPIRPMQYYQNRVDFLKRAHRENLALYKRIQSTNADVTYSHDFRSIFGSKYIDSAFSNARVATTEELNRDWNRNKRKIVEQASGAFVLFPPIPSEEMEDQIFRAAPNVKRPRVYLKLGIRNGAVLGEICVELFTDTCPNTCRLFLDLVDGDTLGHGYVNTCFFRKVPHLYWSGGDVIYNNGFGCYAQRGRVMPIGAENYHYPHSIAGLLSMRVTLDDEMCGMFNITFKPLPQLDLRNVVFGRVIRPSSTYNSISGLGNALSSQPVVEICSTRRKVNNCWVRGAPNSRLAKRMSGFLRKTLHMAS